MTDDGNGAERPGDIGETIDYVAYLKLTEVKDDNRPLDPVRTVPTP